MRPDEVVAGLDLSFARSQGEDSCMCRCPRPGHNPSSLVNNSSLAAGPQFTEVNFVNSLLMSRHIITLILYTYMRVY